MIEGGGGWDCTFCRSMNNVFYLFQSHLVRYRIFTNAIYIYRRYVPPCAAKLKHSHARRRGRVGDLTALIGWSLDRSTRGPAKTCILVTGLVLGLLRWSESTDNPCQNLVCSQLGHRQKISVSSIKMSCSLYPSSSRHLRLSPSFPRHFIIIVDSVHW